MITSIETLNISGMSIFTHNALWTMGVQERFVRSTLKEYLVTGEKGPNRIAQLEDWPGRFTHSIITDTASHILWQDSIDRRDHFSYTPIVEKQCLIKSMK